MSRCRDVVTSRWFPCLPGASWAFPGAVLVSPWGRPAKSNNAFCVEEMNNCASSSEGPEQKFKPKQTSNSFRLVQASAEIARATGEGSEQNLQPLKACAWIPLAALRVVWPCALLARFAASENPESLRRLGHGSWSLG